MGDKRKGLWGPWLAGPHGAWATGIGPTCNCRCVGRLPRLSPVECALRVCEGLKIAASVCSGKEVVMVVRVLHL